MKALLAALVLVSAVSAQAMVKCNVVTNDVGTIIGQGATRDDAQADAAVKCFDRHEKLSQLKDGRGLANDDSGLTVVDTCTNVRCG